MYLEPVNLESPSSTDHLTAWLSEALQSLEFDGLQEDEEEQQRANWPAHLTHLVSCCSNLRQLTLRNVSIDGFPDNADPLTAVASNCRNLRGLQLIECHRLLSPDSLTHLLTGCPKLSRLEIQNSDYRICVFTDPTACGPPLGRLIARLTHVRLPPFTDRLEYLGSAVTRSWSDCGQLVSVDLESHTESELLTAISALPSLQSLTEQLQSVSDTLAARMAPLAARSSGARLTHLNLHDTSGLTSQGLRDLLTAWPRLQSLTLSHSSSVGGKELRLLASIPTLTQLTVNSDWRDLTDADLTNCQWPVGLTELSLRANLLGCLSSKSINGRAVLAGFGGCRRALTQLNLDLPCDDNLFVFLLTQLPRLRHLLLGDCRRVTQRAWSSLPVECSRLTQSDLPDLHELRLNKCPGITNEDVDQLCGSPVARGLRLLWLVGEQLLLTPQESMRCFSTGCPWLERLFICGLGESSNQRPLLEAWRAAGDEEAKRAGRSRPILVGVS